VTVGPGRTTKYKTRAVDVNSRGLWRTCHEKSYATTEGVPVRRSTTDVSGEAPRGSTSEPPRFQRKELNFRIILPVKDRSTALLFIPYLVEESVGVQGSVAVAVLVTGQSQVAIRRRPDREGSGKDGHKTLEKLWGGAYRPAVETSLE